MLAKAAADEPHTPAQWLQRLRHRLRTRVLEDLVARGVVQDVDETQMGDIHVHRYPTTDPAHEAEIRKRLAEALITDAIAGRADRRPGHPALRHPDGAGPAAAAGAGGPGARAA